MLSSTHSSPTFLRYFLPPANVIRHWAAAPSGVGDGVGEVVVGFEVGAEVIGDGVGADVVGVGVGLGVGDEVIGDGVEVGDGIDVVGDGIGFGVGFGVENLVGEGVGDGVGAGVVVGSGDVGAGVGVDVGNGVGVAIAPLQVEVHMCSRLSEQPVPDVHSLIISSNVQRRAPPSTQYACASAKVFFPRATSWTIFDLF